MVGINVVGSILRFDRVVVLIMGLIEATKLLSKEGKLVIVSFHSLEDNLIKNFFQDIRL